jgi:hypothetical protein
MQHEQGRIPLTPKELDAAEADLKCSRNGVKAEPWPTAGRGPATTAEIDREQRELRKFVARQDATRFDGLGHCTKRKPLFRWISEPILKHLPAADATNNIDENMFQVRRDRIVATLASQPVQVEQCETLLGLVQGGERREAERQLKEYRKQWTHFWHRELGLGRRPAKVPGTTENIHLGRVVAEALEKIQRWVETAKEIRKETRRKASLTERLIAAQCPSEYVACVVAEKTAQKAAIAYVAAEHAAKRGVNLSPESLSKYYRDYKRSKTWTLDSVELRDLSKALLTKPNR